MIVGALLSVFVALTQGIIGILPAAAYLPLSFYTAASALAAPLASVAWFLPVTPLINISLLTVVILLVMFVLRVGLWVLSAIRGTNLQANKYGL